MNKILARGVLFLSAGLAFFVASFQYQLGSLEDPGPALFPRIVSAALMLFGGINIFKAGTHYEAAHGRIKNVFIVMTSIIAFAAVSIHVNMIAGTLVLVLVALSAVDNAKFSDVVKLFAGLSAVAAFMTYVLGLNLPLWK
jgi:hypothetical protein